MPERSITPYGELLKQLRDFANTDRVHRWDRDKLLAIADALEALSSETTERDAVIEEVAKSIEAAPLTYAGPDPHVASDLRYLIVSAIRDLKGTK